MCHLPVPPLSFSLLIGRPDREDPALDSKDYKVKAPEYLLGQHLDVGSKIKYIEINGFYAMYENNQIKI